MIKGETMKFCKYMISLSVLTFCLCTPSAYNNGAQFEPFYGHSMHSSIVLEQTKLLVDSLIGAIGKDSTIAQITSEGWYFYEHGDLNRATVRFNLLWLLDTLNANSYWGFGLIYSARCNPDSAILCLKMANARNSENIRLKCDLAYLNALKASTIKNIVTKKELLKEAYKVFEDLESNFYTTPILYCQMAEISASLGNYNEATELISKAKSLGINVQNTEEIIFYVKQGHGLYSWACNQIQQ
jgi:tetratricopeptide (TPR) repeat protein